MMRFKLITIVIVLSLLQLTFISCNNNPTDKQLIRISQTIETAPKQALKELDSIDVARLNNTNKHYYNLLKIKASDKAYIKHSSDSLINTVVNYYESHSNNNLYPEALYYAGRVYCDLGDYPTALANFQNALDLLPDNDQNRHLRGNVLSQTGRLLSDLKLHSQAIPYLIEVLKLDSIERDTFNLAFDNQLLGYTYLNSKNINEAERHFKRASKLSEVLSITDKANIDVNLAAVKFTKGEIDSALALIRPLPKSVSIDCLDYTLSYAAKIYLKAGITDTAFMYAQQLSKMPHTFNRISGYEIMLSPEMKSFIQSDSLYLQLNKYRQIIDDYFDTYESQETLIQNSFYNYQVHQRAHAMAESSNARLKNIVTALIIITLFLCSIILYFRNHANKKSIQLNISLNKIRTLNKIIREQNASETTSHPELSREIKNFELSKLEMRKQLQTEFQNIQDKSPKHITIPQTILQSEAYQNLQNIIATQKVISDNSQFWNELEQTIAIASPDFIKNLRRLIGNKITQNDIRMALLIKCGVTPTQMTYLFGRTKGTISYRRENLCEKILGEKFGAKAVDIAISLL